MNQSIKPYENYCKWPLEKPLAEKGFIVAADQTLEWLLPWWWERYTKYNDFPVTFVDLGLSKEMKNWCKKQGHYIRLPVPDVFVVDPKEDLEKIMKEELGPNFSISRNAWFKKPLSCLQSPYELSVWMDIDCEIKGSLHSIFSLPLPSSGIALAQKYCIDYPCDINSGVILFQRGIPIMEAWAKEALKNNQPYVGDENILYDFMMRGEVYIENLPHIYNWSRRFDHNPDALVIHWHGRHGKSFISHQLQKSMLEKEGLLFC